VRLDAGKLSSPEAPYELVKTMRASVLALGPLLARFGEATVSLPGGCAIGSRPGRPAHQGPAADGRRDRGRARLHDRQLPKGRERLQGASITTDMVTVTGTENFLMAAALAEGETVLENAAQEPEITDLAEMLIAMGARIEGHGTSRIRIQGVERCTAARTAWWPTASRPAPSCAPWRPRAATWCCATPAPTTWKPCSRSCARPAPRSRRWTTASASSAPAAG
jgi:UDP-N-acetylglucosamine enolpyruvyl transferase